MVRFHRAVGLLGTSALALALAAGAYLLVGWSLDGFGGSTAASPAVLDMALARIAALLAAAVLGWWSVAVLACLVTALHRPGRPTAVAHAAARTLPRPLRTIVATAVGMAVAAGTTTTAFAATPAPDTPAAVSAPAPQVAVVDPSWMPVGDMDTLDHVDALEQPEPIATGWAPARPAEVRQAAPAKLLVEQPRPAGSAANEVVVRRGDTLWDICARHLPDDATDAEIAAEWPRWYQANRHVIGTDPNQIQPGQRLRPPSTVDVAAATADAGRAG